MAYAPSKVPCSKGIFRKLPCTGLHRSCTPSCTSRQLSQKLSVHVHEHGPGFAQTVSKQDIWEVSLHRVAQGLHAQLHTQARIEREHT